MSDFAQRVLTFFEQSLPGREGYEERPQQREMALAVAEAIENRGILVVEAGTGTGKSLAYLIPSLLWSAANGTPVIVSTRTLNLQQQLLDHDLPGLSRVLQRPFKAVPARGWSNYVCIRRVRAASGAIETELEGALAEVEHQISLPCTGVRQEMRVDDRLWNQICAESASCSRQMCPHYEECFFFRDRKQMERADLIVTNHSLLLADLSLRREGAQGILPAAACVILDEGHHLEDVANDHLARTLSTQDLARLQQQLYEPKGKSEEAGLLPGLRKRLSTLSLEQELKRRMLTTLDRELLGSLPSLYMSAEEFFNALSSLVRPNSPLEGVGGTEKEDSMGARLSIDSAAMETPAGRHLRERGSLLGQQLERAASSCNTLVASMQSLRDMIPGSSEELQSMADRLRAMSRQLEFCLFPESPDWVYWASDGPFGSEIGATPLDVGETLAKDFFEPARSVIITSATLASTPRNTSGRGRLPQDLSFYMSRVGLDRIETPVTQLCLDSPFDYARQAYLGVVKDVPQPNSPDFLDFIIPPLCSLVEQLGGRTFLLLTSMTLLRRAVQKLRERLDGIEVLAQGEAPNRDLLRSFRSGHPSILVGADSFWEGVDVPGDALQCVVMGRLPFRVPTDPLVQAHCKRLEDEGQSAFWAYQLPRCILRFRQGFGRLIRSGQDRGIVLVLDSRLYHKSYGVEFYRSLPNCTTRAGAWGLLAEDALHWIRNP